jgi:hypothetical protein
MREDVVMAKASRAARLRWGRDRVKIKITKISTMTANAKITK